MMEWWRDVLRNASLVEARAANVQRGVTIVSGAKPSFGGDANAITYLMCEAHLGGVAERAGRLAG